MGTPRVMKAAEFKAKCLELMDEVALSGDVIIITKRGKVVAQLGPPPSPKPASLGGFFKDKIDFIGDVVSPVDVDWGPAEPATSSARSRCGKRR